MKTVLPLAERIAEITDLVLVKVHTGDYLTIALDEASTLRNFRKNYTAVIKARSESRSYFAGYTPSEDELELALGIFEERFENMMYRNGETH